VLPQPKFTKYHFHVIVHSCNFSPTTTAEVVVADLGSVAPTRHLDRSVGRLVTSLLTNGRDWRLIDMPDLTFFDVSAARAASCPSHPIRVNFCPPRPVDFFLLSPSQTLSSQILNTFRKHLETNLLFIAVATSPAPLIHSTRVGIAGRVGGWTLPPVHVYRRSFLSENRFKISIPGQNFKHFDIWPPSSFRSIPTLPMRIEYITRTTTRGMMNFLQWLIKNMTV